MDVNRDDISETRYNLRLPAARAEYDRHGCAARKTQLWRALKDNLG